MNIFVIILLSVAFFCANANESKRVLSLLKSNDWDKISEGITELNKEYDTYKSDSSIRQQLFVLLQQQTAHRRNPKIGLAKVGDSGEIELDILEVVLKYKLTSAVPDLMDWVGNVPCSEFIVSQINALGCTNNPLIDTVNSKFRSTDEFYQDNRSGYLEIIIKVFEKDTGCIRIKKIAHVMLLSSLRINDNYQRIDALQMSKLFLGEPDIRFVVDSLSTADGYIQKRKGKETYPVRIAAQKALAESPQPK